MRLGIIGRPGSGKSTLFQALGGQEGTPIVSVDVPDERMDWLRELEKPKKFTLARVEFVDHAGIPEKEEKGKKELMASIREAEALVIVLRGFTDPSYPYENPDYDPVAEAASIQDEFLLNDYAILETRVERLRQSTKKPTKDRDRELKELEILERLLKHVEEAGKDIRSIELKPDEEALIRAFRFLSQKPAIWVYNHAEGDAPADTLAALKEKCGEVQPMCLSLEKEIAGLDEADRIEFLKDYGITQPARIRLIQSAYQTLGLISFFTTGPDEVRAWTVQRGDNAVTAAGKIHSDLARGFIRGEVTPYEELKRLKSWQEVKAQKKLRLEGKDYVVQDGDIMHIRFNV